jgi:hypothetical protein
VNPKRKDLLKVSTIGMFQATLSCPVFPIRESFLKGASLILRRL